MMANPWARGSAAGPGAGPGGGAVLQSKRKAPGPGGLGGGLGSFSEEVEDDHEEAGDGGGRGGGGLRGILGYADDCRPDEEEDARGWVAAQMAAAPTLLPELKFHDLVFGHELGRGSFSTVKYARQILKQGGPKAGPKAGAIKEDKGRSVWPEFAVKIISTSTVAELGYEQNVIREIAILRNLSHPGIARMVSCFRWRDGVYLVLEYASGGDLHGLVTRNGSLDEESFKFVLGETVAAMCSVHDAGLVFGDLKPENLLLTEAGHVKLTDFGGCRPATPEAHQCLRASRTALGALRDGDWRPKEATGAKGGREGEGGQEAGEGWEDGEEDTRVEGTVAYLAPEVVRGESRPSYLGDAWALGCVAYFVLRGRPPFFAEGDTDLKRAIVAFAEVTESAPPRAGGPRMTPGSGLSSGPSFGGGGQLEYPSDYFSELSAGWVAALLAADPAKRLPLAQAAKHQLFTTAQPPVDVFSLHHSPPPRLSTGKAPPPPPDAKWARRQHSHIWAPELAAYDLSGKLASIGGGDMTGLAAYAMAPIEETAAEAAAPFAKARARGPEGSGGGPLARHGANGGGGGRAHGGGLARPAAGTAGRTAVLDGTKVLSLAEGLGSEVSMNEENEEDDEDGES